MTKGGKSDLAEPLAIRPTSETVMYQSYAKWIRSHRDLPLKMNQWCNVVRWEFKNPQPFLRSREFLWQEGHTCFATRAEAVVEVDEILDLYRRVYEDLLCVPVVKGLKSPGETFPGADFTHSIEGFVPTSGRGIQAATSHHLGQNFSKMFDIKFETDGGHEFVHQNSWGLTTRSIGVMIMVHGDDKGLVLPPRVAPMQVVIVPIMQKNTTEDLEGKAHELAATLRGLGISVHVDARTDKKPGFKYNHWELRGVPLRMELGARDFAAESVFVARRDTGAKSAMKWADFPTALPALFDAMQTDMLEKARAVMAERTVYVREWEGVTPAFDAKQMAMVPFCVEKECEDAIKKDSAAETTIDGAAGGKCLTMPFESAEELGDCKCVAKKCTKKAKRWAMFGRSY